MCKIKIDITLSPISYFKTLYAIKIGMAILKIYSFITQISLNNFETNVATFFKYLLTFLRFPVNKTRKRYHFFATFALLLERTVCPSHVFWRITFTFSKQYFLLHNSSMSVPSITTCYTFYIVAGFLLYLITWSITVYTPAYS